VYEGEILFFYPVALATLCDAAKCMLFCFVALATENKVPYIVVGTVLLVTMLQKWTAIWSLHFIDECPMTDEKFYGFMIVHTAVKRPLDTCKQITFPIAEHKLTRIRV
jgi:hypothetical protein